MRQITDLKEMQTLLKALMQVVHTICEENGLVYTLSGGSLLGAVRHQDIIPWDDDIDITMPRADYNRFKEIVAAQYADRFDLYDFPQDGYVYPFMKFCKKGTVLYEDVLKEKYRKLGLYIDIFPVDGVTEADKAAYDKRINYIEKNKVRAALCVTKPTASPTWWKKPFVIVNWLRSACFSIRGYKHYIQNQVDAMMRDRFEDCDRVALVYYKSIGWNAVVDKTMYLDRKLYPFGEYEFWGLSDAHTILQGQYGDYMQLPPEDKRTPCHNYRLFVEE